MEIISLVKDKSLVFSPPQRVLRDRIVDGERRLNWDMREFKECPLVENEDVVRWHGDSDEEPEDFVGTPSEPVQEVPEDALPYITDDFGHWELVDDSWFE